MSLKATSLTKNSKQSPSIEKAFGNYTKLDNKAFLKISSQYSAHKRTTSDIPQFTNLTKPASSSIVHPSKQPVPKRPQTSTSKSPISSRKTTTSSTLQTKEDNHSRRQKTYVEISPKKTQLTTYSNKSPLATRHDNSPTQSTHRLISESKAPLSSSRYSGNRRTSTENIQYEKGVIVANKGPSNVQTNCEPNLNKRSFSTNVSPIMQWESRITSKKTSVCDISQHLQQLQEEELYIINEVRNKGSASSRPSFETYREHIARTRAQQNNSPFALYSEVIKEKKTSNDVKGRATDDRRLNSSPLSVENRYYNNKDNRQKTENSHRELRTNPASRNTSNMLDKSSEKSLLDIAYSKMLRDNSRMSTANEKETLYTEVLGNNYKKHRANTDFSINVETVAPKRSDMRHLTDNLPTNVSISDVKQLKKTKRPTSGINNTRLGYSDQKKTPKPSQEEVSDASVLYTKRLRSSNASIEIINEEESMPGPSIFSRAKRASDGFLLQDRAIYNDIVNQADLEVQFILGGLQQKNNIQKSQHTREVTQNKTTLATEMNTENDLKSHRRYVSPAKSQIDTKRGLISMDSSFERNTSRSPSIVTKVSIQNPTENRIDEDRSRDVFLTDLSQIRTEKKYLGAYSEEKNIQGDFGQGVVIRDIHKELKQMAEAAKPSHKKNSKSYSTENAFEQIIKGLNLPINLDNTKKEDSLTPTVSRPTSNNATVIIDRRSMQVAENESRDVSPSKIDANHENEGNPSDDEYLRQKLVKSIKEGFKSGKGCPDTTLDHYRLVKMIGRGTFGKVFLGVHLLTGRHVAVKSIEKKYIKDENAQKKIFQEVHILKKLNHSKVIRLLEVFENKKYLFIVLEYASKGDLLRYVKKKGRLSEENTKVIFKQIVSGLRHCHQNMVLHRDIKLDNVLLDENNTVKICDFGVSRFVKKGHVIKEQCGTPAYIAPEIIRNKGYEGCYADIWSLGVLLYAMVTGTVPFKAENLDELHKAIFKGKYSLPKHLSESCKDLIGKMLKINPYSRIGVDTIGDHPWFQKSAEFGRRESMGATDCVAKVTNTEHRRANSMDKQYKKGPNSGETEVSSQVQIIDAVVTKVEELGYPRSFIIKSVNSNSCNHASASYFLLYENFIRKL